MAYQRQVLNEFASSSSQFIEMDAWRRCVDPNATPVFSDKNLSVFVGLDAAPKRDSTAIVAMAWDGRGDKLRLINHVVFQPTPQQPLDFEATIERTLLEWRRRYALRGVWFDPYQMAAVAQRLQKAGIRMVEFAQTQSNLIAIGSNLFELIKSSNLIVYPAAELQLAISHAVAKETSRGFMITKEKQAHKIDVVVALAMASYAAVQRSHVQPVKIVSPLIFSNGQWWSDGQANTPARAGYRPTNEPWRSYVAGPDIGLRTFGPPPGSGPREW